MDPTITIFNRTGAALDFVLPHEAVCVRLGRCLCSRETGAAGALVLPPHGRLEGLPPEILEAPAVRAAMKAQPPRIVVRISTPAAPPRPASGPAQPAQVENRRSAGDRKGKH